WMNPSRAGHLVLGNDGGINISYDDGEHWVKCNTPPVGQFYAVAVDMAQDYNVYGGLQDNGVWTGPHNYEAGVGWHDTGHYPYKSLLGGDGMQVAVDSRDNETVYTGYQFGNYFRVNRSTGQSEGITPTHELGERPLRWNWQTPIHLSRHNEDILYIGSHKLHRSFNQGKDWVAISGDLTNGGMQGDVPFGTLTTIHESPMKFGLIYTGSDDGKVHVTKDGGNAWNDISANLPAGLWVSRMQASLHEQGRVYLALNGYRNDNFEALVFVSENYGDTWRRIGTDLPLEPVNVLKEDPSNPELLYLGTDNGLYASLDRGQNFMQLKENLPAVAVHDLVVHPREHELLVGTHGRSLYLADIRHVQQLRDSILAEELFVFELEKLKFRGSWGSAWNAWSKNVPEPKVNHVVFSKKAGKLKTTVLMGDLKLKTWETELSQGLNYLDYNGEVMESAVTGFAKLLNEKKKKEDKTIVINKAKNGKYYLQKGTYKLVFEKDGLKIERNLTIE
ncbi:MAG: glycosyl hydrolase, partial [Saprospiraceae bacterium]|nr:glycosyl hydrolase [Saprospiraceae bacterium]